MRKAIKKPLTSRAEKMALTMLERLRQQGHDPNMSLKQSEFYEWKGLFPPKPEFLDLMGVDNAIENAQIVRLTDRSWSNGT